MNLKEYRIPSNIEEASELLARKDISSEPILLGTYPIPLHERTWEAAIDLRQIGLTYIDADEANLIRIGSLTSLQEIVNSNSLQKHSSGILPYAAKISAHRGLRNLANIGGTLLSAQSAPELCLALMILKATVICYPDNEWALPLNLNTESIMTEIRIPIQSVNASLERVSRTPLDKSIVCSAVALQVHEDNITNIDIAVSGISEQPIRIPATEIILQSITASISPKMTEAINTAVKDAADPKYSDYLGSAEYRIEIATILTNRAIKKACLQTNGYTVQA